MCLSDFLPFQIKKALQIGSGHPERSCSSAGRGGKRHSKVNIPPFPLPWQPAHCRQRLFHPPADHRHLLMDVQCASPFWLMEVAATPGQLLAGASSPLQPLSNALLSRSYVLFLFSSFWGLMTSGSSYHEKGSISP